MLFFTPLNSELHLRVNVGIVRDVRASPFQIRFAGFEEVLDAAESTVVPVVTSVAVNLQQNEIGIERANQMLDQIGWR